MSQLGKCSCGTTLIKSRAKEPSSGRMIEVDICPRCVTEELRKDIVSLVKTVRTDKYGMEVLEK
jgi:hypothetical protein